jgi:hypothetical protein
MSSAGSAFLRITRLICLALVADWQLLLSLLILGSLPWSTFHPLLSNYGIFVCQANDGSFYGCSFLTCVGCQSTAIPMASVQAMSAHCAPIVRSASTTCCCNAHTRGKSGSSYSIAVAGSISLLRHSTTFQVGGCVHVRELASHVIKPLTH